MNTNPMQLLQMIRGGQNPQQLMLSMLEKQSNTPLGANLLNMARNNDTQGIEQVARNLASQKGIDFDKEFAAFRQQLGI